MKSRGESSALCRRTLRFNLRCLHRAAYAIINAQMRDRTETFVDRKRIKKRKNVQLHWSFRNGFTGKIACLLSFCDKLSAKIFSLLTLETLVCSYFEQVN